MLWEKTVLLRANGSKLHVRTSYATFLLPFNVLVKAVVVTKTRPVRVAIFLGQQHSFLCCHIRRNRKTSIKLNNSKNNKVYRRCFFKVDLSRIFFIRPSAKEFWSIQGDCFCRGKSTLWPIVSVLLSLDDKEVESKCDSDIIEVNSIKLYAFLDTRKV